MFLYLTIIQIKFKYEENISLHTQFIFLFCEVIMISQPKTRYAVRSLVLFFPGGSEFPEFSITIFNLRQCVLNVQK